MRFPPATLVLASLALAQDPPPAKPPEQEPVVVRPERRAPRANDADVGRGLRWLAAHQDKDGASVSEHKSDKVSRVGLTGLSLLTFLAAGSTPTKGTHAKAVAGAVGWLRGQMDKDGLIGTMRGRSFAYEHAIATLALALTVQVEPDEGLRKEVGLAVQWIEKARNPYKVWRYFPRDGDNDTSVTGWMVAALVAPATPASR